MLRRNTQHRRYPLPRMQSRDMHSQTLLIRLRVHMHRRAASVCLPSRTVTVCTPSRAGPVHSSPRLHTVPGIRAPITSPSSRCIRREDILPREAIHSKADIRGGIHRKPDMLRRAGTPREVILHRADINSSDTSRAAIRSRTDTRPVTTLTDRWVEYLTRGR